MDRALAARLVLALVIVLAGVPARAQSADRETRTRQLMAEIEVLTNELGETSAQLGQAAPLERRAPLAHPLRAARPRPPIVANSTLDCTLGALTNKARQQSAAAPTGAVPMNCALGRLGGVRKLDQSRHR